MAELDLTPPVGQLFGDHPVAAGPAVMEGAGFAGGIGRPAPGQDQPGEIFVAGTPGAALAEARAGRPRGALGLKLAAPAPGEVDHPVAIGRREDRGGEPVEAQGGVGVEPGTGLDHMGFRVEVETGGIAEPRGRVAAARHAAPAPAGRESSAPLRGRS